MLREVVAEATLHAGRSLVRGVQLDVGRRHANDFVVRDVKVDLAADAAVGTHGANDFLGMTDLLGSEPLLRHHLENRARRADANAFTTPRAPRFIRIAIRADDDFGVLTPPPDVEDADDLNVLAGPHAAGAEDAGRHVVADHGIARPLVARAQRQIAVL